MHTVADIHQGCILSPCFFNLHMEYIMQNARLDDSQAGTQEKYKPPQISRGCHFMAEKEEELKSLLKRVKEDSEKAGLKLNTHKNKIMASGPITSWQIEGETREIVT